MTAFEATVRESPIATRPTSSSLPLAKFELESIFWQRVEDLARLQRGLLYPDKGFDACAMLQLNFIVTKQILRNIEERKGIVPRGRGRTQWRVEDPANDCIQRRILIWRHTTRVTLCAIIEHSLKCILEHFEPIWDWTISSHYKHT